MVVSNSEQVGYRPYPGVRTMSDDPANPAAVPAGALHALASSVPDLPAAKDIDIDPDKVLDVARVIETHANSLQGLLDQRLGQLHIDPPAQDLVSRHAIEAWNQLVADGDDSYATRVRNYVDGLRTLADQVREASHRHRAGEEAKAASFRDRHRAHPA